MDTKTIGKWSYLIGLLVAIVAAFIAAPNWLGWVLIVLAVLTGLFLGDTKELTNYGVRYLALVLVASAYGDFPFLGPVVTTIANAMVGFFGPIILTVLLVFNFNQALDWIRGD